MFWFLFSSLTGGNKRGNLEDFRVGDAESVH